MTTEEAVAGLASLQKTMYAYDHALNMLYYDATTIAPEGSAEGRGEAVGMLSAFSYQVFANPETGKLLSFLREHSEQITPQQRRETEILTRAYERISRIPVQEYTDYSRLLNEANVVWHRAKRDNDFPTFAPCLENILNAVIRFAGYYDASVNPYDATLEEYEPGLTMEQLDHFFANLRQTIVPLLKRIATAKLPVDDQFLYKHYPIEQQRKLSDYIMDLLGIDRNHCILGETEHPFTLQFNKYDVRVTTKYLPENPASSLYSVIHECGHGIYELNTADELRYTRLAEGTSMGIHESQSRLFENMIGRSEAFVERIFPKLCELFPQQLEGVTAQQFYLAVNKCEPSLIRTEADELTYSLHVMVRYDIEKLLFSGKLTVAELPEMWAQKMREYLGVEVPDDTRGVLQDSHWSGGSFGYFPSYAIGSAYAAQIMAAMQKDLDVDTLVREGNFAPIVGWLTERIYQYGKGKDPDELLQIATGQSFDPNYYIDYLVKKYSAIYELA